VPASPSRGDHRNTKGQPGQAAQKKLCAATIEFLLPAFHAVGRETWTLSYFRGAANHAVGFPATSAVQRALADGKPQTITQRSRRCPTRGGRDPKLSTAHHREPQTGAWRAGDTFTIGKKNGGVPDGSNAGAARCWLRRKRCFLMGGGHPTFKRRLLAAWWSESANPPPLAIPVREQRTQGQRDQARIKAPLPVILRASTGRGKPPTCSVFPNVRCNQANGQGDPEEPPPPSSQREFLGHQNYHHNGHDSRGGACAPESAPSFGFMSLWQNIQARGPATGSPCVSVASRQLPAAGSKVNNSRRRPVGRDARAGGPVLQIRLFRVRPNTGQPDEERRWLSLTRGNAVDRRGLRSTGRDLILQNINRR